MGNTVINTLSEQIDLSADSAGHIRIERAANIIRDHRRWNDNGARKGLIGALAREQANAFTNRSWHWVHDFGSTRERDEIIKPQFWNSNHVDHRPTIDGRLSTSDAMDWEKGEMRIWRHVVVAALPWETQGQLTNLIGLGPYQVVHWEYCAQYITLDREDVYRLACDRKLQRYGTWLDDNLPNKPGRPDSGVWEQTKAALIAEAAFRSGNLLNASVSKTVLEHYVRDRYGWLSANGSEPYRRDLTRFVSLLWDAIESEKQQIPP
jgi:hypothetical protein